MRTKRVAVVVLAVLCAFVLLVVAKNDKQATGEKAGGEDAASAGQGAAATDTSSERTEVSARPTVIVPVLDEETMDLIRRAGKCSTAGLQR